MKIIKSKKKRLKLLKNKEYNDPNKVECEELKSFYDIEDDEDLSLILNHFPHYLAYVYSYLGLGIPTPIQNRIANILGYYFESSLILEAGRGIGKSWIGSIFQTYIGLRDVDSKTLVTSATSTRAGKIGKFLRSLYNLVPILSDMDPNLTARSGSQSFDLYGAAEAIEPSVSCVGIEGQITGNRASFILADDIEIPQNSATEEMRGKIFSVTEEFQDLLIPDKPSKVLMLGTPQSMESVYGKIPYRKVIIPAEVPDNKAISEVYEGWLDEWVLLQGDAGDPVDNVRFPVEELEKRKSNMARFKLQYMLDTSLADSEKYPLKTVDLIVMPMNEHKVNHTISYTRFDAHKLENLVNIGFTGDRFQGPYAVSDETAVYDDKQLHIDVSGKGSDETAWVVIGTLNGRVHLLDWGGTTAGFENETLILLANKAKEWGCTEAIPEANYGDGMWGELFKPILTALAPDCGLIEDYKVTGRKETRLNDILAPFIQQHKLIVNEEPLIKELDWVLKDPSKRSQYSLIWQMTHFEHGVRDSIPHDDRLDALANAINYNRSEVGHDQEEMLKLIKEQQIKDMLDNWHSNPEQLGNHNSNASKGPATGYLERFGKTM